ncbi:MAG: class I SAM-dependent methyltransferase [Bradyrhizobium sp.]
MSVAVEIANSLAERATHHAGTFGDRVLQRIEELIGSRFERTLETGCGKSTIFFSRTAKEHLCFAIDDRSYRDSSVAFVEANPLFRPDACRFVFGPTQATLPRHAFAPEPFDVVLLDGPHGYPFVELEYYFVYPHIRTGGYLIVDDVHIPTIGRFADFLFEDPMFELVETISTTALFRRTMTPLFDPLSDGWWQQPYNRRRVSPKKTDIHLADRAPQDFFTTQGLDHLLMEGRLQIHLGEKSQGAKPAVEPPQPEAVVRPGLLTRLAAALRG